MIIIPNDGILILFDAGSPTLVSVCPQRCHRLGAWRIGFGCARRGPWPHGFYNLPGSRRTSTWAWTSEFFAKYGLLVVFGVALTPSFQQPAVILVSLANTPLMELTLVIFVGRFIKFLDHGLHRIALAPLAEKTVGSQRRAQGRWRQAWLGSTTLQPEDPQNSIR